MTRLHDLYDQGGQSPWIDDLRRSYIERGELARLVDEGIRGVTSNPTIMTRAIEAGSDYDAQFAELVNGGEPLADVYWDLVLSDVLGALTVLRPTFDGCGGRDGFVSVEVSPALSNDTTATVEMARQLHRRIHQPNALVKVPATEAGVPAIRTLIGEGHSINVTLIFSLERYDAVIEAYIAGLEELHGKGGDLSSVASVASFFVSRVDTEVDRRLDAVAQNSDAATSARALELRGRTAVAQARLAYALFRQRFSGPRWEPLAAAGARLQRPLWASTSTKNPAYPDLLYVDSLIGPDTVNTMPEATIAAFLDHGTLKRTVDQDEDGARAVLAGLVEVGVDLDDVSRTIEDEGVAAFAKSFDELAERLEHKAAALKQAK